MVNLPSGTPVKSGLLLADMDFPGFLAGLEREKFNGYACLTAAVGADTEEGILIFDSGRVVAAIHEYFRYDHAMQGDDALPMVLNAAASEYGVLDTFKLSAEQVQLVLAFNETALLSAIPTSRDLVKLIPRELLLTFQEEVAAQFKPPEEEAPREEVLRKYGITEVYKTTGRKEVEETEEREPSSFEELVAELPPRKAKATPPPEEAEEEVAEEEVEEEVEEPVKAARPKPTPAKKAVKKPAPRPAPKKGKKR